MSHLAEDQSVVGDDTLNGVEGAVGVVFGVHAHLAVLVTVLERDLAVLKKLFGQRLRHYELALAVADCNLVDIAFGERGEPWGIGAAHAGTHDAGDMSVDVVAVEGGGVGCYAAEFAEWQQSGLDQRLEAVADAEHQTLAI